MTFSGDFMNANLGLKQGNDVAELLSRGACDMAFQSIRDLKSGRVYGYEALLRGINGIPLPCPESVFGRNTYLSEEILLRLDIACIGSALRSGEALAKNARLFINVHARTLSYLSEHLPAFFGALEQFQISRDAVVFELSELTDPGHAVRVEQDLKEFVDRGIEVAVDDVGFSFTWLHHMLHTKPSYIKIDKAYVAGITQSRRMHALVESLHRMCGVMGVQTVPEGIEAPEQLEVLRGIGIGLGQGFLFERPKPAEQWLAGEENK
jgi:EAL domain-containing protein (putative c-di-GMP-specific phosphodiesterase class I)